VQNVFGITCNPNLPYDPSWQPVTRNIERKDFTPVSRRNFIEACLKLTAEDEKAFEKMWKHLALSVDWNLTYSTISPACAKISQASFLDLAKKGYVYQTESPTMWDIDFQTAVAQAEVEDRPQTGAFFDLEFSVEGGGKFTVATTRPELLAACIAVVAHPDDARYQKLFGKFAVTPFFNERVPILSAAHAEAEKGSGILMICTFGDINDVEWWKKSGLPVKQIIGRDGRILAGIAHVGGLRPKQARKAMAELLGQAGKSVEQAVKFFEKGDSPLEFITTRQWFVKILPYKKELAEQGEKIHWHPGFMKSRYQNWVEGLNQDWCISRQRFFGVPFPVWYPLDSDGNVQYEKAIYATEHMLPVDPLTAPAPGFSESQRGRPNGFIGDPDVMDTWATSSLSPKLAGAKWPTDLRPQSHEIIRTWAFYTIVKAWMHERQIPWKHVAISGWVLDPDRKKMSKSKGNVVTPDDLLKNYSSDAVRYWAAKARLGADTAYDEKVFGIGQKLTVKLFNASKFVMGLLGTSEIAAAPTEALDLAFLNRLKSCVDRATALFGQLDCAGGLEIIETTFWSFCDHYIELVKTRAYREEFGQARLSALAALDLSLKTFLCLFAPFLPYVTEEIWSWRYSGESPSVHLAKWPQWTVAKADETVFDAAVDVLSKIRGAKSEAKVSMKAEVARLEIACKKPDAERLRASLDDVLRAGNVISHSLVEADVEDAYKISVELAGQQSTRN
jgi:valyl-tRNA synthetase